MPIFFNTVERASNLLKNLLEEQNYSVEATSAPSVSHDVSLNIYRKYIALTERVLDLNGNVLCYITYRVTQTRANSRPKFSSYELLDANYEPIVSAKWHLREYGSSFECLYAVYDFITHHYDV